MATPSIPIGQGLSPSQWEAWFNANTKSHPKFVGSSVVYGTQLQGKTWAQVFSVVYNYGVAHKLQVPSQYKGDSLQDAAAAATIDLATQDGIGVAAADTAGIAANQTNNAAKGIETTNLLPSWADGLATFLSDLTSSSTWIRVAEVVIGGVLLIVGLAHITGATQVIEKIPPVLPV